MQTLRLLGNAVEDGIEILYMIRAARSRVLSWSGADDGLESRTYVVSAVAESDYGMLPIPIIPKRKDKSSA